MHAFIVVTIFIVIITTVSATTVTVRECLQVCLDALSSGKYYHFIRLMGRAASNITLECALQTHPNVTLLGEEVAARKQNLSSITEEIVHVILEREAAGE